MGLLDFLKKGVEKPVENKPVTPPQNTPKAAPVTPPIQPTTQTQTYTVKGGDSLSKIAKQFYGDANQWKKIHQANLDKIKDPNLIHPGDILVIPQ